MKLGDWIISSWSSFYEMSERRRGRREENGKRRTAVSGGSGKLIMENGEIEEE